MSAQAISDLQGLGPKSQAIVGANRTGMAPWPRSAVLHRAPRGQVATRLRAPHLACQTHGRSILRSVFAGFLTFVGAIAATVGNCQARAPLQPEPKAAQVVFVCEHGNVKSLIAASLFNQLAEERGLPFRGVSRGLNPEKDVPAKIADALRGDGVDVKGFKPQPLTPAEVAAASRVIAIGVDLTSFPRDEQVPTELWNDVPPASIDYGASRAALLRHIGVLLDELQAKAGS